jgi:hypothetical protein
VEARAEPAELPAAPLEELPGGPPEELLAELPEELLVELPEELPGTIMAGVGEPAETAEAIITVVADTNYFIPIARAFVT